MSPSETTILLSLVISSTTTLKAVKTSLKMNLRPFKLISRLFGPALFV